MGRPVALAALVVAVLTCLAALVLAFTPLFDAAVMVPVFPGQLATELHRGPPPCLRYDSRPDSIFEVDRTSAELIDAGIESRRLAELVHQLEGLRDAREAAAHQKDEVDEMLEMISRGGPVARVLVALKGPRLRRQLHRAFDRAPPSRPTAPMTAEEHRVLDPLLERHPALLGVAGVLAVVKSMRVEETRKKLDALAASVTERGELDEPGLPKELLVDAWGGAVKVSAADGEVRFTSLGADRVAGGEGDAADLVSVASLGAQGAGAGPANALPQLAAFDGSPPPAKVTLRRAELEHALEAPAETASQARVVPAFEGGKAIGFKFFGIRTGSIFLHCGLANGDVVTALDGLPLTSPDQALEAYSKVRGAQRVTLSLLRQGKPYLVHIELK